MKRAAIFLLRAIPLIGCALGAVRAAAPDTFSPVVSYQYLDSLSAPGTQTPLSSPVVSYQYFDRPSDENLTFQNSPAVSYLFQYPAALSVAPDKGTAFGSVPSGGTRDQTFTLKNSSSSTVAGMIDVVTPFSVVGGNSYTLTPGQSKTVTVRFSPTAPGGYSAYLTFSNGSSWLLTASAFADFTATTGSIAGRVTVVGSGAPLNGVTITVVGPGANVFEGGASPGAITGGSGAQAGRYEISGLAPYAHYHVFAASQGQQYYLKEVTGVAIMAGQTKSLNISLDPITNTPPVLTTETTPLVMVRGLGPNGYPERDPTWGVFSARLRDGSHHNFTEIWDCSADGTTGYLFPDDSKDKNPAPTINGERELDYNAPRLLQYIRARALDYKARNGGFYPPAINIVTHSMGGLIVRQAVGQSDRLTFRDENGQSFQIKINKVIMLAPPNAGSYLSDVARDPIGLQNWVSVLELKGGVTVYNWFAENEIPSLNWKSTKNLRTTTIRQFSRNHPWPDAIDLQLLAATAGSATTGSLKYSSNWILARLRDVQLEQTPEAINDGAVTQPSVIGNYYEIKSQGDLLTSLVKSSTFRKMTGALVPASASDVQITGSAVLDHFSVLTDSKIIDAVASVLHGNPWPVMPQASAIVRVSSATAAVPSAPSQLIESRVGSVSAGGGTQFSVVSDAASKLSVQLLADSAGVVFKLQDPSGNMIGPSTPQTNSNVQYTATVNGGNVLMASYSVGTPAPGTWNVIVDGTAVSGAQADYLVTASVDSNVTLLPQTASLFNQGQDAIISCALVVLGAAPVVPVVNATLMAAVQLPDRTTTTLKLADDGLHNDGAPNDGVYAAVLPGVVQAGEYMITYRVTGANSQGQALQRVSSGAAGVSSANANLLGDPAFATVDTDGDGVADSLQVKCAVNPRMDGNYLLSGQLTDAGLTLRIPASAQFRVDGGGAMTVSLFFDLSLAKAASLSGVFRIEDLQLFELPSSGTAWVDTFRGTASTQITFGPRITTQAQNLTAVSSGQASFTVVATDSGSITYQWQLSTNGGTTWTDLGNTGAYSGVNTATLAMIGLTAAMNGYQFRAMVGNAGGATTVSAAVTLTVNVAPVITMQPTNQIVSAGTSVTFTVAASGTPTPSMQWQRRPNTTASFVNLSSGGSYSGVTTATLTVSGLAAMSGDKFRCLVSNGVSPDAISNAVTLSVNVSPTITSANSVTFVAGQSSSFAVNATGSPPPTFSVSAGALPSWASLNATTGVLAGTPPNGTGAPFSFTLSASNGIVPNATQVFTLAVQVPRHSADTSPADGAINLVELTRVLELYNTRNGTLRTGRYAPATGTVDGFAPEPTASGGVVVLTRYHSADTNQDGRLSLIEITRVIELFNTRSGTTRTGAYRVLAGSEDGFAPGP